jgi:hypothetical protein
MDLGLLCRQHAHEAIEKLLDLLRTDDNRAVAFAIQTLLDRGFGKAKQLLDVGGSDLTLMHLIAAKTISAQLQGATVRVVTNADADAGQVIDLTPEELLARLGPALE